jgi:hypothetical protein
MISAPAADAVAAADVDIAAVAENVRIASLDFHGGEFA